MPTVRRADRSVEIAPLRGGMKRAAATPESEGAGVERARADTFGAVAGFGETAARVGIRAFSIDQQQRRQMEEEEKRKADQIADMAATNALSEWQASFFYDPQNGAFLKKGKDAQNLPTEAQDSFKKAASAIEAGLSTDEQRTAFKQRSAQVWNAAQMDVYRHTFKEQQAYGLSELNSLIDNKTNEAIQHATDPLLVKSSLDTATTALANAGKSLGMGPEEIASKTLAIQTKTHVGVIHSLLAQEKNREAADYFTATKGQIDGEQQDGLIKALDEGTLRGQSQKAADKILREGLTDKEQRERAAAIEDPKLRDLVEARIEHAQAIAEREERETEQATIKEGYDILDRTQDVTKIPPAVWTSYTGATRSAMISYANQRAKGEPTETNDTRYYGLLALARDKPAEFATWNIEQYRHELSDHDYKQLLDLRFKVQSGDKAADKNLAGFQSHDEIVSNSLWQYTRTEPKDYTTAQRDAKAQLLRMLDTRFADQMRAGKRPTNEEIQGEVDNILSASVKVPGSYWNFWPGGKSVSDTQKRLIDTTAADIPANDRAQIEAALRARRRPVSDATVLDLYLEAQLRRKK
jgi:hypothetical protein